VWTRPQSLDAFSRLLQGEPVSEPELLADVVTFAEHVKQGAGAYRFTFVPTWTLPHFERGLGLLDGRAGGWARAVTAMNLRLMDALAGTPNVFVLNAERWVAGAGRGASPARGWYLGKIAFHADVLEQAAADVHAALTGLTGGARKLVVLDLDDTLWGGVVGDVGWQALRLGGHDGVGEALVDFQRALKRLSKRGVVLAVVSKNEESVALEAIRSHPEMVLREKDFVGWRINWNDKAQNIADLAAELNLGLQSVVFIDDNPVERARVREALPELLVPEWPDDKLLYPSAFAALRCFDTGAISREDAERTGLYASERQREALKKTVGNIDEWLATLETKVRAEPLGPANLARTAQLLNKTNQLNLSTRRCSEAELSEWVKVPGRWLWALTVSDRFGDAGLTGILSVEAGDGIVHVVDFVLSCRVMGRRVEETMVHLAVEMARDAGAARVEARHLPTAKNKPCLDFWKRSGFEVLPEGVFGWDASKPYALPKSVTLEWAH
jgi:FkbH-like protein